MTTADAPDDGSDAERQFHAMYRRVMDAGEQLANRGDESSSHLISDLLQELSAAFEELEVNFEEIHAQNEALEAAQERIDRETQRYRELFDEAPDGYLVTDDQGIILEANRAMVQLFATPPRLLYSKPVIVFVDSADRRTVLGSLHDVLYRDAEVTECQITIAPPNGRRFPASLLIAASAQRSSEPRTLRWLVRDESRRMAVERALSEERARYRVMADSLSDVVFTTDELGRITNASPSVGRMLGYTEGDLEGSELSQIVHPDDWQALTALENKVQEGPVLASESIRLVGRSRESLTMSVTVAAIAQQPGMAEGRSYAFRDLRDRQESELALRSALVRERHAAIALREADSAKEALLLAASHDLSSPVAAVAGLADRLVAHDDLPEGELRGIAEAIATAGSQLRAILANLLDAERVLDGHVRVRSVPTDLHQLVAGALEEHGLPMSLLDPPNGPVLAELDPGLTARIVDNIVGNALRHTPAGTPIRVQLEPSGVEVTLSVIDRGPGIPDDAKEAVFDAFHQDGRHSGLGLGLFVVRRFAELQGGRTWVSDTKDGGATVNVTFAAAGPAG